MLRIITDFDGPIMDVSERYYRVYQFCLAEARDTNQPVNQLTKEEFWRLKRAQVPERQIGILSGLYEDQARQFAQLRRQTVHTLPYLVHDKPVPGAIAALTRIQQSGVHLVVMTMRRVKELDAALEQYELGRFFPPDCRYCLSNHYVKTQDIEDKPLLMKQALEELSPAAQTWMVGDTEADIAAAKQHGVPAIAVLSGIRNKTQLSAHEPDQIVRDLGEAVDRIFEQTLQVSDIGFRH
ncbi:MAG: HAD family hydrolase [Leptolyngbyaceae cyanobacterium MO_188.B28]|nr:HAD family hydrolase [Leptolyngbyaceae cyanobacterium MO_188.B28]